jgi:hypothetical protein
MARSGAALRAQREEAVQGLAAVQLRAFDASMFISFVEAKLQTNDAMETFLAQRFRPEMKHALEAWLKLDPLTNTGLLTMPVCHK